MNKAGSKHLTKDLMHVCVQRALVSFLIYFLNPGSPPLFPFAMLEKEIKGSDLERRKGGRKMALDLQGLVLRQISENEINEIMIPKV